MIKQRAIKLRLKLNTLGKNYNLILVTFCLNDDNLVIPYTDIHMEDAKVIFNELNISKYGGKAINITFYEFNPGISKALEFIFK